MAMGVDASELNQSHVLSELSLEELAELYKALHRRVHWRAWEDVPGGPEADPPPDPGSDTYRADLEELSRIEHEAWSRYAPWMLRMRSALEASVAAAAPDAEVHVAIQFNYPGPPSGPLAVTEYRNADPLAIMALVGFTLRVRPAGSVDDTGWTEVFLGGVDARTAKVFDREDYSREWHHRHAFHSEPGLQEPDLWPSLLIGSPTTLLARASMLAALAEGAFDRFGKELAEEVIGSIIEAAIMGPPDGWNSGSDSSSYERWKLLLDAVYEVAREHEPDLDDLTIEGVDTDEDGIADMTPAPSELLVGTNEADAGADAGDDDVADTTPTEGPLDVTPDTSGPLPGGSDIDVSGSLALPDDVDQPDAGSGTTAPSDEDEGDGEQQDTLALPDDDEGIDTDGDGIADMTPAPGGDEPLDLPDDEEGIDTDGDGIADMTPAPADVLDGSLDLTDDGGELVAPPDLGGAGP